MEDQAAALNGFLVEIFNQIMRTEERWAARRFRDLSLRELHLLEEVCRAQDQGRDNRAGAIAAAQGVTAGTLTTVVSQLEKKGYLVRRRDERDRRAVRILPTGAGREADKTHAQFHREMVAEIQAVLDEGEAPVLVKALGSLTSFFRDKYENKG